MVSELEEESIPLIMEGSHHASKQFKKAYEKRRALDRFIEEIGFGWYQTRILLMSLFGVCSEIHLTSATEKGLRAEFGISYYKHAVLPACGSAFVLVGFLLFQKVSHLYGRKRPYQIGCEWILICNFLCAYLIHNFWLFLATRILLCLGIGALTAVDQVIFVELCPKKFRYRYFWVLFGGNAVSLTLLFFIHEFEISWRTALVFYYIPLLISWRFRVTLAEEPPVYLIEESKVAEAFAVLSNMYSTNHHGKKIPLTYEKYLETMTWEGEEEVIHPEQHWAEEAGFQGQSTKPQITGIAEPAVHRMVGMKALAIRAKIINLYTAHKFLKHRFYVLTLPLISVNVLQAFASSFTQVYMGEYFKISKVEREARSITLAVRIVANLLMILFFHWIDHLIILRSLFLGATLGALVGLVGNIVTVSRGTSEYVGLMVIIGTAVASALRSPIAKVLALYILEAYPRELRGTAAAAVKIGKMIGGVIAPFLAAYCIVTEQPITYMGIFFGILFSASVLMLIFIRNYVPPIAMPAGSYFAGLFRSASSYELQAEGNNVEFQQLTAKPLIVAEPTSDVKRSRNEQTRREQV